MQDRLLNPYPPLGGTNLQVPQITAAYQRGIDGSYGWIYATQPSVRSVIDFVAANAAQLALKLYERVSETEREGRPEHPAAQTMLHPDGGKTPAQTFIYRLFTDYLIWDNAYVLKFRPDVGEQLTLVRLQPNMVTVSGGRFTAEVYTVWRYDGTYYQVSPDDVIHWYGYNPEDPLLGLSKLETLRDELATDRAIQAALIDLAKSGLKGGYIKRPLDAPEWNQQDAERFAEQWRAMKMRTDGGDPILDEGMEWEQAGIAPKDAEVIASRQFSKEEVASVYGVPLAAMGLGSTGTANPAEQRKLVYADVLPPICDRLAGQLNEDILRAEYDEADYYFEFNYMSKLEGDLENRYPALTAAAGRPWQTVNEVRAAQNLPPVDGGDDLTIPLNISLAGEQGSPSNPQLPAPNVMPPQDPNAPPQDGSHRTQSLGTGKTPEEYAVVFRKHFERQERLVARHGTGALRESRWNRELTQDLCALYGVKASEVARAQAEAVNEYTLGQLRTRSAVEVFREAKELHALRLGKALAASLGERTTPGPTRLEQLRQLKEGLDLPDEVIWEMAGFQEDDIDRMNQMRHTEALLASTSAEPRDN